MKLIILAFFLFFSNISYSKTVAVIIPFSPGGPTDQLWRFIEPALNERLSKHNIKLITENMPGAGGTIAANKIASTTDRLSLGFFSPSLAIAPGMVPDVVQYNTDSIKMVGYSGETEMFVVSSLTNEEFIKKCQTTNTFFGSSNIGSTSHLLGLVVGKELNCKNLIHVPYKGISAAYIDLIASRIDFMIDFAISADSQSSSGKINKLFPVDDRFSNKLESWHVFVSNTYYDPDLKLIKQEFNNLKKDKKFVDNLEKTLRINKFSTNKDQAWLVKEFETYNRFIKTIK